MSEPFFFTWSQQRGARGIELVSGNGAEFTTTDGRCWLDLGSLSYHANLGHGERRVIDAIHAQTDALCVAMPSAVYPAKRALAERLLALAPPGFTKVFFTLGGAEANENAIKMARLVTGRHKVISRYRSYHGATLGALSVTGDWRRVALEPGLPGVVRALDAYCRRCPFGHQVTTCARECAQHIGDLLELEGRSTVAAVILEAIPGANGVLIPPDDYLSRVRQTCNEHGALLICDEVLTGFGRTGRAFAFEHYGVEPDMITVAKGLTGGYAPLGAVLVHERVACHFEDRVLPCGLTNYAHPLGCAAALAALQVYAADRLFDRAIELGQVLARGMADLQASCGPVAIDVRSIGMLAAIELEIAVDGWRRVRDEIDARGVYAHVYPSRGLVVLAPPLCIAQSQLEAGLEAVGDALHAAQIGQP